MIISRKNLNEMGRSRTMSEQNKEKKTFASISKHGSVMFQTFSLRGKIITC